MRQLITAVLITTLTGAGLTLTAPAMADQHGKQMHGKGMGQHAGDWKATLSDEQRNQLAGLKLEYKKQAIPLKLKIKQAKVELALLITSDKPDDSRIDKKIDEITKLKNQKMRLKARHKIAVRKLLTAEQRVYFDMKILKKAARGKGGHGRRGHH